MRFYTSHPKDGDIKTKRKFLIFPRKINNEIRWLEFAILKYVYEEDWSYSGVCLNQWKLINFINK